MNIVITGGLVALAYLFSKYLMALFITNPTVVRPGAAIIVYRAVVHPVFGASAIFASIMRASGTRDPPC